MSQLRAKIQNACGRIPLLKIISGGQTGVDRAALDWALARGVPHGGWCPRHRRAEDGRVPARFKLKETYHSTYRTRTRWNVRDSDGTVIFSRRAKLTEGSQLTADLARKFGKPWLHLCAANGVEAAARRLKQFIQSHEIMVLNVAGPRASTEPHTGKFVNAVLSRALKSF